MTVWPTAKSSPQGCLGDRSLEAALERPEIGPFLFLGCAASMSGRGLTAGRTLGLHQATVTADRGRGMVVRRQMWR